MSKFKKYIHNIKYLSNVIWNEIDYSFTEDAFYEIWEGLKLIARGLIFVGLYKVLLSIIIILLRIIFIGILGFITIPIMAHFRYIDFKKKEEKLKKENMI